MIHSFTDKIALVTGAGQPPGAAAAQALAQAGASLVINDLNPDRAERTAQAVREMGGRAIAITADVANKFQCVHLIETARMEYGRLDILINAMSVRPEMPLLKMDEWDWQRVMDVNVKGVFFMSQLCDRVFVNQNELTGQKQGGVIINLGTTWDAPPYQAAYTASQAALHGLTLACGRELTEHGVKVHLFFTDGLTVENAAAQILALCQLG